MMNYKTNIKARKRIMIDTNTKIIESNKFLKERHKWNWRQEIGKEIDAEDLQKLGVQI
jgi:hypothetical protein